MASVFGGFMGEVTPANPTQCGCSQQVCESTEGGGCERVGGSDSFILVT